MALPKWFRKEMLPFYDAQPGVDWGVAGLFEQALSEDGSPHPTLGEPTALNKLVKVCSFGGMVKESEQGRKILAELPKILGLRLISHDLRWDRDEEQSITTGRVWMVSDESLVSVTFNDYESNIMAACITTDDALIAALDVYFKTNTHKEKVEEYIYAMVQKNGRIQFQRIGTAKNALERHNYSADVLKGYDRVIKELNADKPRGRIAIFDGPPGTGKTYMVRAILNEVRGVHIMIPSHMVSSLADPSILPAIIDLKSSQEEPILFIIEDGDEVIAPRGADNMPAISSVLNLGDGILGACLDIRVVITTNAKRAEMDEAMTRPGRLISIVHIGRLTVEETNEVYKRITGTDGNFTREMTIAEIYSKALDGGFEPVERKKGGKMGFGS